MARHAFRFDFTAYSLGKCSGHPIAAANFCMQSQPPEAREQKLIPYRQVVGSGRPVYTIHDVTDRNGRIVHYERLLLPFARDGENVDRILASFEFISPDGAFDNRDLMAAQTTPPALRLSATIEPQTTV